MYLGPQHHINTALRTSAVAIGFFLVLFLVKITTPNPPYPEFLNNEGGGGNGIGLEVNLGSGPDGMGDDQQLEPLKVTSSSRPTVQEEADQEKLLTNEEEDSEKIDQAIEQPKVVKPKKTEVKKPVVKPVTTATQPVVKSEPTPKPIMDLKNVFSSNNSGGNEGTTGKPGDQGNPNGVVGSKLYTGDGSGSGGGTGGGSGTGHGTGIGSGISLSLAGRSVEYLQKPEYNIKEEGVVVVEITVDKNGNVTNATPILKGTTTQNAYLWRVAKEAALKAKFNSDSKAAAFQKGTIRYHFELN